MNTESPVQNEAITVAYEGEDERDHNSPMSKENSDFNLESRKIDSSNSYSQSGSPCANAINNEEMSFIQGGHVNDPGMAREERWASPKLIRSCSNLDLSEVLKKIVDQLPPSKIQSYEKLQELAYKVKVDVLMGSPCSQSFVLSHRSADKVIPKKHS